MAETTSAESVEQGTRAEAKRPSRFVRGLLLGLALGVLGMLVLGSVAVVLVVRGFERSTASARQPVWKVEAVPASKPWVEIKNGRGRLVALADGSCTIGDFGAYGAVGRFEVEKPVVQDGLVSRVVVGFFVTPDTVFTMGGKPWTPRGASKPVDAATLFRFEKDGGGSDALMDYLDRRVLTVDFKRVSGDLIALRVDATFKKDSGRPW